MHVDPAHSLIGKIPLRVYRDIRFFCLQKKSKGFLPPADRQLNMEFIWLASSANRLSEFRISAHRFRVAESPEILPALVAREGAGTLVIEVSESGVETAFSVIERWQSSLRIWIFDPAATVASSVQWMKAGASHVATTPDEIEQWMLDHTALRGAAAAH